MDDDQNQTPRTEETLSTPEGQETTSAPEPQDQASITTELDNERSAHQATRDQLAAAAQERDQLREQAAASAGRYREVLLAAAPEVPPELVAGATIDEVDQSLAAAQSIVQAVLARVQAPAPPPPAQPTPPAPPVPAGAPARSGPDLDGLNAAEKIKWALAHQDQQQR